MIKLKNQFFLLLLSIFLGSNIMSLADNNINPNNNSCQPGVSTSKEYNKNNLNKDWKKILPKEVYHITREKGTEQAFTGKYWNNHDDGIYKCVCCGQELFDSQTKFDSGTGWPSFYQAIDSDKVDLVQDNSYGMNRTEVTCKNCGAHLGHIFNDGPYPTFKRFCINSASLNFDSK